MRCRTHRGRAVIATVAAGAALLATATPAQAGYGQLGQRETICATDLQVRTAPVGARLGTLVRGETFLVKDIRGSWVYGFAYGHINTHGWVEQGWFYPLPCSGP